MSCRWKSPSDLYDAMMWNNGMNRVSNEKGIIYVGREGGAEMKRSPLLIAGEGLAHRKIGPYILEGMEARDGYYMNWLGGPVIPRNGRLRGSTLRWIFLTDELGSGNQYGTKPDGVRNR